MAGAFPLCYSKTHPGAAQLCFSKRSAGVFPLVYKGDAKGEEVKIDVVFSHDRWICQTYNVEHQIQFSTEGFFSQGSGTVSKSETSDKVTFTLENIEGSSKFVILFSEVTGCVTDEDPDVSAIIVASQAGQVPKSLSGVSSMINPNESTVTLSFDANGHIASLR